MFFSCVAAACWRISALISLLDVSAKCDGTLETVGKSESKLQQDILNTHNWVLSLGDIKQLFQADI